MTTAILYRMSTEEHLCPFGLKSKDLLEREGFEVEDHLLRSRDETDAFMAQQGVETTPQTFIHGERIGGYDDLRERFGLEEAQAEGTTYAPVIAVFACAALAALALQWRIGFAPVAFVVHFVSLAMLVLAILKLRDVEAFTNQFLGYDLLSRRWLRFAYLYPFAEAAVAVGMLTWPAPALWMLPVALVAVFIGAEVGWSVYRAVYVEERELKCACVGGNSNVPLGAVSLTESMAMLLMGAWMLFDLTLRAFSG